MFSVRVFLYPLLLSALMYLPFARAEESKIVPGSEKTETASFRIKRDLAKPRLYGNVEHNTVASPKPYTPMEPALGASVQANDYLNPATSALSASASTDKKETKANFVWGQSAAGGYFDCTGQVKELVMGDQLHKYGGKFSDGTAVPTTPVVCNFKGHVYKPYVVKRVP